MWIMIKESMLFMVHVDYGIRIIAAATQLVFLNPSFQILLVEHIKRRHQCATETRRKTNEVYIAYK